MALSTATRRKAKTEKPIREVERGGCLGFFWTISRDPNDDTYPMHIDGDQIGFAYGVDEARLTISEWCQSNAELAKSAIELDGGSNPDQIANEYAADLETRATTADMAADAAAFRAELAERAGPEWNCTPENPCDGECAEHSLDAELAAQGLRLADEDEAGDYVLVNGGNHVWATDAPPRFDSPVAAPIFEAPIPSPDRGDLAAALEDAVTARLPIPRNTPEWHAAQAVVEQAHEALDPVGYRAARGAHPPAPRDGDLALWGDPNPLCPDCGTRHDPLLDCPGLRETGEGPEPEPVPAWLNAPIDPADVPPSEPEHDPCAELRQQRDELLAACKAALADTLKPQHLQEPDTVIPMLKAAIARAALGE